MSVIHLVRFLIFCLGISLINLGWAGETLTPSDLPASKARKPTTGVKKAAAKAHPCTPLFTPNDLFYGAMSLSGGPVYSKMILYSYTNEDGGTYDFDLVLRHLKRARERLEILQYQLAKTDPQKNTELTDYREISEGVQAVYDHLVESRWGRRLALLMNQRALRLMRTALQEMKEGKGQAPAEDKPAGKTAKKAGKKAKTASPAWPYRYVRGNYYIDFKNADFQVQDFADIDFTEHDWQGVDPEVKIFFDLSLPVTIFDKEIVYQLNKVTPDDQILRQAALHGQQYQKLENFPEAEKRKRWAAQEKFNDEDIKLSFVDELKFHFAPKYQFSFQEGPFPLGEDRRFHEYRALQTEAHQKLYALIEQRIERLKKIYPHKYQEHKEFLDKFRRSVKIEPYYARIDDLPQKLEQFDQLTDYADQSYDHLLYTAENYERIIHYLEQQAQLISEMQEKFDPLIARLEKIDGKLEIINRQPLWSHRQAILTHLRSPAMQEFLQKVYDLLNKYLPR